MKKILTLTILLALPVSTLLAEVLVYPTPQTSSTNQVTLAAGLIITDIFQHSNFTLKQKVLPATYRRVTEMAEKRLDIIPVPANENTTPLISSQVLEIYPEPLFSLPVNYYSLRDSSFINKNIEQLHNYRLGVINMPRTIIDAFFDYPLEKFETYNSYPALVKGLITRRIDLLLANSLDANHAFQLLNVDNRIVMLEQIFILNIHIGIRSSLPPHTKEAIYKLLDERLPEFKRKNQLKAIFTNNNLNYNAIIPPT